MQLFSDAWEEVNRTPEIMRCWLQKPFTPWITLWVPSLSLSLGILIFRTVESTWISCSTLNGLSHMEREDLPGQSGHLLRPFGPDLVWIFGLVTKLAVWTVVELSTTRGLSWRRRRCASTFWDLSGSFQRSPVPLPPANWTQSLTSQQIRPTKTIAAQWGKASSQSVVLGALVESYFRVWLFFQSQITNW